MFPGNPPFGEKWPNIIPYLSVARPKRAKALGDVAIEGGRKLHEYVPIKCTIPDMVLIENVNCRWAHRARFRLGN